MFPVPALALARADGQLQGRIAPSAMGCVGKLTKGRTKVAAPPEARRVEGGETMRVPVHDLRLSCGGCASGPPEGMERCVGVRGEAYRAALDRNAGGDRSVCEGDVLSGWRGL